VKSVTGRLRGIVTSTSPATGATHASCEFSGNPEARLVHQDGDGNDRSDGGHAMPQDVKLDPTGRPSMSADTGDRGGVYVVDGKSFTVQGSSPPARAHGLT